MSAEIQAIFVRNSFLMTPKYGMAVLVSCDDMLVILHFWCQQRLVRVTIPNKIPRTDDVNNRGWNAADLLNY